MHALSLPCGATSSPPAPGKVCHAMRFNDVVQQAHAFEDWDVHYAQLSSGAYDGAIEAVSIGSMTLMCETSNQVVTQTGGIGQQSYVFGVPLNSRDGLLFNGRKWTRSIAATRHGREFCVRSDRTTMLLLEITAPRLAQLAQTSCDRSLHEVFRHGACHFDDPRVIARFTSAIGLWMESAQHAASASSATFAAWQQAAERELLDVLADVLTADAHDEPAARMADANRVSTVHRALAYMHAHIDEPLQVIDVCEAIQVSRRTLQNCFQSVTGTNPQSLLRAHRLSGARSDLMREDQAVQVKDVVQKWGFWHLSRFSESYRLQFGELPSVTAQRNRDKPSRHIPVCA